MGVFLLLLEETESADNSKTLTLKGTNLAESKLTKADITVANNTVDSVTYSADRTTATVKLTDELTVDEATKVTVKDASFDVTYKVEATTVSVDAATYDDDTKNQFALIKIDGKAVTAQELINAGYDVTFAAYTSKAATTPLTTDLFNSTSTGELKTDLGTTSPASGFLTTLGLSALPVTGADVYVKVTLTKGSDVITSDLAKVKIQNIDLAADTITGATLLNYGTNGNADGAGSWSDDFEQNSSTLVTGETAAFSAITVKAGTEEEEETSGYTVKSSDASVVSVDSSTGVLTAEGPGTATITVTYGGATYTKTITVKNGVRTATKVSATKTSVGLTSSTLSTASTYVTLLDQFGDPMTITSSNVSLENSNPTVATAAISTATSDETGVAVLTFTGANGGAGSTLVTFRDASGVKIGTTTVKATVTDNDTLAQYSLTADTSISTTELTALTAIDADITSKDLVSTDATLDIQADKFLKVNIAGLNSAGVTVSDQDNQSGDYTITTNVSTDGVLDATNPVYDANGYLVVKAGTKTGTATITVTNNADSKVVKTFKVTVTSVGYNVTAASLKTVAAPTYATTLTYKNFLTYKAGENDPVITGLTLSKSSAQPIRLDEANDTLYIDKDADGIYTPGTDVLVGSVVMTTSGSLTNSLGSTTEDGIDLVSGDEGTVLFKVLDNNNNVIATKAVSVDF